MRKVSKTITVYKKGQINDVAISLVLVIGKLIKSLLEKQIRGSAKSSVLFGDCQYGFRRGTSTEKAILSVTSKIINGFDSGELTRVILICDLSRAFDCISNHLLINKLELLGFANSNTNITNSLLKKQTTSCHF